MTQRNQFGGNVILPLTDHFGFGLPGASGDSATGPRIIANSGSPNGTITAPLGSFALDFTTPGIWQNTDGANAWNPLGGGSGGGGILPLRDGALVDPDIPTAVDDTNLNTPFLTIQAAVDALEAKALAASGGSTPYTVAAQQILYTVYIAQGIYDENISIPAGLSFILVARGTVILGDGTLNQINSSNARSLTWFGDNEDQPASGVNGMTPTLALTTWVESSPSADADANVGSWRISGRINLSEAGAVGAFLTGRLSLENVQILDNGASGSALTDLTAGAAVRAFFRRVDFGGNVVFNVAGGDILLSEEVTFRGSITCNNYGTFERCVFLGSFTGSPGSPVESPGLIDCDFANSLTWTGALLANDYTLSRAVVKDLTVTGAITDLSGVGINGVVGTSGDPGDAGTIRGVGNSAVGFTINGNETCTLSLPDFEGQEITLSVEAFTAGFRVVSVIGGVGSGGGVPSSLTFSATTQWILLKAININGVPLWRVVSNPDGVIIS